MSIVVKGGETRTTTPADETQITPSAEKSEMTFKFAEHMHERVAAFHLVYQNYLKKGLIEANSDELRVTPYQFLPTTNTFITLQRGRVIASVSLIGDGQLGIPMESIYSNQVQEARRRGLFIGEVSSFALQGVESTRHFLPIFINLTRLMAQHARAVGIDQLWLAAHPKHARFYERYLGFERIGTQTSYPSVRGAPAVACCLDFARIDRNRPQSYKHYFGVPISKAELRPRPMTEEEIEFFRPAAELVDSSVPVCLV